MPKLRGDETLDATDIQMLRLLHRYPRATVVAAAQQLNIARSTVQIRLARLEELGLLGVEGAHGIPAQMGYPVAAIVMIEVRQRDFDSLSTELRKIPEVIEAHGITGDGDVICMIVAASPADVGRVTALITDCRGVERTRTSMVIRDIVDYRLEPLLTRSVRSAGR